MKHSRVIVGALVFGVLAIGLWLMARAGWQPSTFPDAPMGVTETVAPAGTTAGPVAPVLTRQLPVDAVEAPLPPVDAPLADTFDELVARADSGDYRAACRLAVELQVCHEDLPRMQFFAETASNYRHIDLAGIPDNQLQQTEAFLIHAQAQLDAVEATQAHCRGVPEVGAARRLGWWRQSARAGSRASLQGLVAGEAFPAHTWARHADHLAWMGRELEPLAWRAIHAGDLETAWNMMNALTPKPAVMRVDPLSQVTDVDGETALALAVYLQEALGSATGDAASITGMGQLAQMAAAQLEATLTPEAQVRAHATSREWRRTIKPLPVSVSPFTRHAVGEGALETRQGRMQLCEEPR